jgi:hypothetical protein
VRRREENRFNTEDTEEEHRGHREEERANVESFECAEVAEKSTPRAQAGAPVLQEGARETP